MCTNELEYS